MTKVNNIKRIIAEDFSEKDQELIRQLSFSLNPLLEQVTSAFVKGIDFDNLNMELMYINTEVDSSGVPKVTLDIKSPLKTKLRGCTVINVTNLTDSALLTGAPFIAYELISGGLRVNQVTGLVPNTKYRLTLIIF